MFNFITNKPYSNKLKPQQLKEYQRECILHSLYNPNTMLWLQMGLGKTIISLTAITDRMRAGQVKRTLIFGPLRVINSVWATEAKKWEHTCNLSFSILQGSAQKRIKGLFRKSDITLINYENMNWLAEVLHHYYTSQGKEIPFQMIIYDEISKLKNSTSLRMGGGKRDRIDRTGETHSIKIKGWRDFIDKFKYRIGLTGTPAPNGYIDLHGQYLAIDGGKRLGRYITHYRNSFFIKSYSGWSYNTTEIGKKAIEISIGDITKKMDNKDYLDMPEVKEIDIMLELPGRLKKKYKELEKELFVALDSGTELEVHNQVSLYNKALQFANGAPYINSLTKEYEAIHEIKLEALADILEEAAGSPVLCSYSFISDALRIMKFFKKYKPVNLTAEPANRTKHIIDKWNKKEIKLLIGHPASMGHGIDGLQHSGSIVVWFGLNWSYELYEQMNGRIARQGQTKPVSIIRILCKNTTDIAVQDAIETKCNTQENLKAAIDRYRLKNNS